MFKEIEQFVNWVRRRNPDAHTWRSYQSDLAQFIDLVGEKSPAEIAIQDIDNFINQQVQKGMKAVTVKRRLAAIASLFQFLADEQPGLVSPVIPHRHTIRIPFKLPRSIPQSEIEAVFSVIDSVRDKAIFMLMLRCGLRVSEVSKLTLKDVYLAESPIRLLVNGKNSRERSVYLSQQATYTLRRYLSERKETTCENIFLTYDRRPLGVRGIQKRLKQYCEIADVQFTPHQLRHNFANDLVLANVPVTSIQKLMGHAWITTTELYLSANNPKVKQDFYSATKEMEGWS